MFPDVNYAEHFFHENFIINVLSLGNCRHRWFMQRIWHLRVNHVETDIAVSYPPSVWSPLLIPWGRISFISYYYLGWYLIIYYGAGVPVFWLHHYLLELVDSTNSEWDSITEFHIPPCELFHGLLLYLWIFIILPNYNGIECFWTIIISKGVYGVLESLDISL